MMHETSQVVSEVSVQEAVEDRIRYGTEEIGIEDDDVVVRNDAVGHEKGWGECCDEDHTYYEQDQGHPDVGLAKQKTERKPGFRRSSKSTTI